MEPGRPAQPVHGVLLDIDGVLHVGMQPVAGASQAVNWLEREGKSRQTGWIAKTGYFKLRDTASFLFGVEFFTRIAK